MKKTDVGSNGILNTCLFRKVVGKLLKAVILKIEPPGNLVEVDGKSSDEKH